MKLRTLETFRIRLPFRFAFSHSLAKRAYSSNLIVKLTLDDGTVGYGEGVPREYVTGEDIGTAEHNVLTSYVPLAAEFDFSEPDKIKQALQNGFKSLGLEEKRQGASWCAFELAVLDACSRSNRQPFATWLGTRQLERVRYGGVVPFAKEKALVAMLFFYKFCGYKTVKLKVGNSPEVDQKTVALARQIMGPACTIRVDANCAWNLEQAQKAHALFKPYTVASYEQPFPADDWDSLRAFSAEIEEDVIVDESLCTISDANQLADGKYCDAFNIRISKVGGLLPATRMVEIAKAHGLRVHLGAQVGESAILSSSQRLFATLHPAFDNYEGSANFLLLKKDLSRENLTAGLGGWGDLSYARNRYGNGLNILDERIQELSEGNHCHQFAGGLSHEVVR